MIQKIHIEIFKSAAGNKYVYVPYEIYWKHHYHTMHIKVEKLNEMLFLHGDFNLEACVGVSNIHIQYETQEELDSVICVLNCMYSSEFRITKVNKSKWHELTASPYERKRK